MNEHPDEQVAEAACDPNSGGIPPWTWPEWLTCVAIARDGGGLWFGFDCIPVMDKYDDVWVVPDVCGDFIALIGYVDTSGFPQVPWNESLRMNPSYKAF